MAGFDHLKRAARDQRKAAARTAREQRKRQRRCFWTRPFRHEYVVIVVDGEEGARKRCVSCDKLY